MRPKQKIQLSVIPIYNNNITQAYRVSICLLGIKSGDLFGYTGSGAVSRTGEVRGFTQFNYLLTTLLVAEPVLQTNLCLRENKAEVDTSMLLCYDNILAAGILILLNTTATT